MDTDTNNQTKKVNIFNQEERPILCIANEHDYLGDGTMFHEYALQVGQQYTFVKGEAKSYGSMVHLKELPSRYGYQSYLFEELQAYDLQIFEKANRSWLEKMLVMGESAIKKGKRIAQTALNVSSPVVSMLPSIHPALLSIPIIASVYNESCAYFDAKSVEKRLLQFQQRIEEQAITIDELQEKIDLLNEHSQYVFRNNIRHLCLSALPETTDLLIDCLISYLMNETQDMDEELCEIICSCNANDMELLKIIKQYMQEGSRAYHQRMIEQYFNDVKEMQSQTQIAYQENTSMKKAFSPTKWYDRNMIYGEYTIFWKDFTDYCHLVNIQDMGRLLNEAGRDEDGFEVYDWALLTRALLKMQSKGVVQLEFINSTGIISQNNVDRFHITTFGQKILEHIRVDD